MFPFPVWHIAHIIQISLLGCFLCKLRTTWNELGLLLLKETVRCDPLTLKNGTGALFAVFLFCCCVGRWSLLFGQNEDQLSSSVGARSHLLFLSSLLSSLSFLSLSLSFSLLSSRCSCFVFFVSLPLIVFVLSWTRICH